MEPIVSNYDTMKIVILEFKSIPESKFNPNIGTKKNPFSKNQRKWVMNICSWPKWILWPIRLFSSYRNQGKPLSKKLFKKQFWRWGTLYKYKTCWRFFTEFEHYLESKKGKVVKDVIKDYNSLKKHLEGFQEFSGIIIDLMRSITISIKNGRIIWLTMPL